MRLFLPVLLALPLLGGGEATAQPQRLRVLGSASLDASVGRGPGDQFTVKGQLVDDAGSGVPRAWVQLTFPPQRGPSVKGCDTDAALDRGPGHAALETDAAGKFCARLGGALERTRVVLAYGGPEGLLGSARLEVDVAPAPRPVELRLQAPPELPLDTALHVIEVDLRTRAEESGDDADAREPFPIRVELESPHRGSLLLGELMVLPGERGRLELPSSALGSPGAAILVARFDGSHDWAPAEARRHLARTAEVRLQAPSSVSTADLPVELEVGARWSGGPASSGSVEALADGARLGAAPVVDGKARLLLTPPAEVLASAGGPEAARVVPVQLVYVPSAPWWRSGPPVAVELLLLPPPNWTRLGWLAATLGVLAWVSWVWRRPKRSARFLAEAGPAPPPGKASLVVEAESSDLRGQVLDGHTAEPVSGARLQVALPGLETARVLCAATADADGRFVLDPSALPSAEAAVAALLRIEARGYAGLERPLPRRGRLVIHLITVRRAALERLVAWARRKGDPWHPGRELPTPAHIARTAELRQESSTASWARQVETAAYGPTPPDETVDRDLRDAEPP